MPNITDPITIREMEVKNRFSFPPCLTGSSDSKGRPTQRSFNAYEIKARGGVGLMTYEASGVHPTATGGAGASIGPDDNIPAYKKMTAMVHKYGVKFGMQIAGGGIIEYYFAKMAKIYVQPYGPSNVDLYHATSANQLLAYKWKEEIEKDKAEVRPLTVEEIIKFEDMFARASKNIMEAGFDFVEIHSCHGSLYHTFLSPYLNKRTDEYGGSYENRCRFLLETVAKIRKTIGEKPPIFVRISGDELVEDGNKSKDTVEISKILEKGGVDCIDVTQGVIYRSPYGITIPTYIDHGGFIHLAEAIKKNVDIPVIGVGRISDPRMANEFIQQGKADIINMARQLICDPCTPNKFIENRFKDIKECIGCLVGCGSVCVLDAYGGQNYTELIPSTDLKKIVILGAGIAGMEAARVAKRRGHEVVVYEKSTKKGGLMPLLAAEYKKGDFIHISNYLENQLEKLGVPVHLNRDLNKEEVSNLNPDILVLAAGSEATIPVKMKGKTNVLTQDEAILKSKPIGKNVVIWGLNGYWYGGAETVLSFIEEGYNVEAFVGSDSIVGRVLPGARRFWILEYLRDKKIPVYTKAKLLDVTDSGVKFLDKFQKEQFINADTLVYCGSRISNGKKFQDKFEGAAPKIVLIGDCRKPKDIRSAMYDAQKFARSLN